MSEPASVYQLPDAQWSLRFSEDALRVLHRHVQRRRWSKESVGQLYSRDLTSNEIVVDRATVLTPMSAGWARVQFHTRSAIDERQALFLQGLHCVGWWHTHPEPRPSPSGKDRKLARDHALAARVQLAGLVFAILGTDPMPSGLRVWVDDGSELRQANPQSREATRPTDVTES